MGRITVELLRKRSEHNEGEIRTLKELSLHQQKLEKIENLDRWCRDLEILFLQNNNISKIENVSRLKCLKYLNLTLNNIEIVEGLEGCESLEKLDLTLNFIGQISSVQKLVHNIHLKHLYLKGNPCTEFPRFKDYIVTVVPQITTLDSEAITKTQRLLARQGFEALETTVLEHEIAYKSKREAERKSFTDFDIEDERFWSQSHPNTPEIRALIQKRLEADEVDKHGGTDRSVVEPTTKPFSERKLFRDDGSPYNINDAKHPLKISDEPEKGLIVLEIALPKFLDTSLIEVDIQPTYVRVFVKKKLIQVTLSEEVRPDSSCVQRSTASGALVLKMPTFDQSRVIKFQEKMKKASASLSTAATKKEVKLPSEIKICEAVVKVNGESESVKMKDKNLVQRKDMCSVSVNEDEVPPLE